MDSYEAQQDIMVTRQELEEKRIMLTQLEDQLDLLGKDGDVQEKAKLEDDIDDLLTQIERLEEEESKLEGQIDAYEM